MVKLFCTGVTGYIGGEALYRIAHAHPEYEITALVRNSDKGAKVAAQYPSVKLVYGDLDAADVIEKESAAADIVCHWANADHPGAAEAIARGLATKTAPAFWIHTSGTGILSVEDALAKSFGKENAKVYDDWDGVGEVTSLPDAAAHRNVDKIVLAAGTGPHSIVVKTAIVCPPCIYGPGRGPDNTRSIQAYEMARLTLQRGEGVQVLEGKNHWTMVHVQDLSKVYLKLVEDAAAGGGKATWGAEGYYFTEAGDFAWGDVAQAIAKEAKKQGLIQKDTVSQLTADEAEKATPFGSYLWGMNSRCKAIRSRKLLGWKPTEKSLFEEIPDIVAGEAKRLGLVKGHAEVAAGNA